MGGDLGPQLTLPATVSFLNKHPACRVSLFGDAAFLSEQLAQIPKPVSSRMSVQHCPQVVTMDDKPASALRRKRESSMWMAIKAVADGEVRACVSAGNTGALMAMGLSQLGALPTIDRPAICTAVPTLSGKAYLLDMGANIECSAEQLWQFAVMASAKMSLVDGIASPRVGLLNVGQEESKGDAVVQSAARLLENDPRINYAGFVEGDGIFSGNVDIVVCDGFVGNVALKSSEGVARMIAALMKQELTANWWRKLGALVFKGALADLKDRMSPERYNGASLLGLNGVVIKSHGGTSVAGFESALEVAMAEAENSIPARIAARLEDQIAAEPG
jgi:glycerol-3-phosphate acyltransferase PlsX